MSILEANQEKVPHLLRTITLLLAQWLEDKIANINDDWWKLCVLPSLSYQQQQRVSISNITTLSQFDLAAILRIIDKNWFQLASQCLLDNETRSYLKELQLIRNRWAHTSCEEISADDIYRDVDTIIRLAKKLNLDSQYIADAVAVKKTLQPIEIITKVVEKQVEVPPLALESHNSKFALGTVVALKSNPTTIGAIVQIFEQKPENRYGVLLNNKICSYYKSQLQIVNSSDERDLRPVSYIHQLITALQISHPSSEVLYSLNSARIDFVPYQYRPVLKFIRSDRPRLLIADGVGVGKTIEAGLIMRELAARDAANSVLIICPKALIAERKWEQEMRRFDEVFAPLDGKLLRYCIDECNNDGEWPARYQKCILPFSLLDDRFLLGQKGEIGYLKLDPQPHWDLVVVDEAHHIRNASTQAFDAVKEICENADAVIFLTATPLQTADTDLFNLLSILRPDLVIDNSAYANLMAPNPYINQALSCIRSQQENWQKQAYDFLKQAERTTYGQQTFSQNADFQDMLVNLQKNINSSEEKVRIYAEVEKLHTLNGIISRTRRRDIGDFTIRTPQTVEIQLSTSQQELYDAVLEFEHEALALLHGNINIAFMTATLKRQAASSVFGLASLVDDIIARRMDEFNDCAEETDVNISDDALSAIKEKAEYLRRKAESVDGQDQKLEALRKIIAAKSDMPNNKLMVFSSFRHTLHYLENKLKQSGIRVATVDGEVDDAKRREIRNRFKLARNEADALDVLLFSEVGCEGLDYQFCDSLVNYDLPWNPMRIEQRIGRIDRRGQKSEKVLIYNLITANTIDAEIYSRCLLRIGVFEHCIGECDAILGSVQKSIEHIVMDLTLSAEERQFKLQQLADSEIRNMEEQKRLEDSAYELFCVAFSQQQLNDDIAASDSSWLQPHAIQELVKKYLASFDINPETALRGSSNLKTLCLSGDIRVRMLSDYKECKKAGKGSNRKWESYLKGGEPNCKITFDSETARENTDIHFINPLHPLVKMAAKSVSTATVPFTICRVATDTVPAGNYPFALYAWEYSGLQSALNIIPVCRNEEVRRELFNLMDIATSSMEKSLLPPQDVFEKLDEIHHQYWTQARDKYQERSERIFNSRMATLNASYSGRKSLCLEQLNSAFNEKIVKMKKSQLLNIEQDYSVQVKKLEEEKQTADIQAHHIAYGIVIVETEK